MAKIVLVNFSWENASGAAKWNRVDSYGTDGDIADLLEDDGSTSSGWDLDVTVGAEYGFGGGTYATCSGDAAWVDDEFTAQDCFYVSTQTYTFTINGLDNSKTYDFDFFPSANGSGTYNSVTEFSTDNFSSEIATCDAYNGVDGVNKTEIATISGVSPSSGTITVRIRRLSGEDYGYFNAMRITENDAAGPVITDVDGDESWADGATGLVITGTGFVG